MLVPSTTAKQFHSPVVVCHSTSPWIHLHARIYNFLEADLTLSILSHQKTCTDGDRNYLVISCIPTNTPTRSSVTICTVLRFTLASSRASAPVIVLPSKTKLSVLLTRAHIRSSWSPKVGEQERSTCR